MLIAAWFEASPLHSMLMMLAFGLGTLPLMTAISWSGSQFSALFRQKGLKTGIAAMIFLAGADRPGAIADAFDRRTCLA